MIYLALSIICSSLLMLIFKLFEKYKVDNLQAIVVNYFVASTLGFWVAGDAVNFSAIPSSNWFVNALVIGTLFIAIFNVMALTTQKVGISTATVANKMSVVIPVVAAVFLYNDSMPFLKIVGIVLAMLGVYLSSRNKGGSKVEREYLYLPLILFVSSGFLDTTLKYTQHWYLSESEMPVFVPTLFFIAGSLGFLFYLYRLLWKKEKFQWKSVVAGIGLGIPNYGSIYFLLKTLEIKGIESSVVFPVNNMGIVALSALSALLFFKEKLSPINWIGIVVAIAAIAIIAFS